MAKNLGFGKTGRCSPLFYWRWRGGVGGGDQLLYTIRERRGVIVNSFVFVAPQKLWSVCHGPEHISRGGLCSLGNSCVFVFRVLP